MPAKPSGSTSTAARGRASMSRTGSGAQSTSGGSKPGRPSMDGSAAKRRPGRQQQADEVGSEAASTGDDEDEEEEDEQKTIPPELLTRLLHEFFTKDGSRITRDANAAVAKYMDVFVREAIARSAAESEGKFMEVEDLEKVAPQLLLDL